MSDRPSDREAYNALARLNQIINERKRNHQAIEWLDNEMWENIKVLQMYGAADELKTIYLEFVRLGYTAPPFFGER